MSSCLTCIHARKPKTVRCGFIQCYATGQFAYVHHVCRLYVALTDAPSVRFKAQVFPEGVLACRRSV